ncbi:MAG: hypothetical protein ACP5O3_00365 [Candidatus Micrarchaeia archaeon]
MVVKRLWAFAPQGSSELAEYLKLKNSYIEGLKRALGEEKAREMAAKAEKNFDYLKKFFGVAESERATALVRLHGSFVDGGLTEEDLFAGASAAKTLGLKNHEKPVAALFLARLRKSFHEAYGDGSKWLNFLKRVEELAKQKPSLKDLHIAIAEARAEAASAKLQEIFTSMDDLEQEIKFCIFGQADLPEAVWRGERLLELLLAQKRKH